MHYSHHNYANVCKSVIERFKKSIGKYGGHFQQLILKVNASK